MVYSIASSSNLTIRFTFAVNAVKYICRCIKIIKQEIEKEKRRLNNEKSGQI